MIKYIDIDYPGLEDEQSIFKLDYSFEKNAFELADSTKTFISNIKPKKGSAFYLANIMGAHEWFGSNNRGDSFTEKELIENVNTFVSTPAHVFISHVNKDPQRSIGVVMHSAYNPVTKRVELVQRIDFDKVDRIAPEWVKNLILFDKPQMLSMGCKIDHEYCSVCGKKNKFMHERCDHLKNHMHEFIDGVKVAAFNVKPRFFDSSLVMRGADRTARTLAKIATDISGYSTRSTKEASYDPAVTVVHDSDIITRVYPINSYKPKSWINENTIDKIASHSRLLTIEELNHLSQFKFKDVLALTKVAGAELLPEEYQYLYLKNCNKSNAAENFYNNKIRFEIPESGLNHNLDLSLNIKLADDNIIQNIIANKSLHAPFVLWRHINSEPTYSTWSSKLASDKDLDFIGRTYVDYISQDNTKIAGILDNFDFNKFLTALFFSLPGLSRSNDSRARIKDTNNLDILAINEMENNSVKTPRLVRINDSTAELRANIPNPLYRNSDFLKKASIFGEIKETRKSMNTLNRYMDKAQKIEEGVKKTYKVVKDTKALPAATGAVASLYLAGKDRRREAMGDRRAGTGLPGFARKHPFITGIVGAGLSYPLYKGIKLASDYSEFLKTASMENLLEWSEKIPDDLFFEIIESKNIIE